MTECRRHGLGGTFTGEQASRDATRYRDNGLDSAGQKLVEFLTNRGVKGATVIDAGGGIGALGLELLEAGAARVITVELSSVYDEEAMKLAAAVGLDDRVERRVLDVATSAAELPLADIVVMHRVVCCYKHGEQLVAAAGGRARRLYAFSFPRSVWWTRAGVRLVNGFLRLRRSDCLQHVHEPALLLAAAGGQGLELAFGHEGELWWSVGFERSTKELESDEGTIPGR